MAAAATSAAPASGEAGVNPEPRPMPAFLSAMMQANQNMICTAKGEAVRKVSIAELLTRPLEIPIFQRRYTWCSDQWATLWHDVENVAAGGEEIHQLGRLTCAVHGGQGDEAAGGRVLVVDGQQRNTTVLLLLAALRDSAAARAAGGSADAAACRELEARLEAVLLPRRDDLEAWLAARGGGDVVLEEGEALHFAALLPTYCDRAPFFAAVLPPRAGARLARGADEWQRPLEAKAFFVDKARGLDAAQLSALAGATLGGLEWLLFPIDLGQDRQDGTENLQVIFERLALREKMVVGPSRRGSQEAANMGSADFVRNLLLGSFADEAVAVDHYQRLWLPIERAAGLAAARQGAGSVAESLEAMLEAFLRAQPEKAKKKGGSGTIGGWSPVGGALYSNFRQWLAAAMEAGYEGGAPDAAALEKRTGLLLERLHAFAVDYYQRDPQPQAAPQAAAPAARPRLPPGGGKWRCSRCSFTNPSSHSACTACCLTRA